VVSGAGTSERPCTLLLVEAYQSSSFFCFTRLIFPVYLSKSCLIFEEVKTVSGDVKLPLWVVATIAVTGVLTVVGIFFYGAYAGVGSAL
jgi:photosystem II PsbJ protein